MHHPNLTTSENATVELLRDELTQELGRWPEPRRSILLLALVVELAGEALRMTEGTELRDTERAPRG